ncbi:hypothetical protein IQ249_12415 [Lusitaniella coriacea LEGE 07157]|uniref:Uncharacterized protein n=1 Tax=Lusitaniella coriacea LEGE 07157 TaxID=945747 RepID=A0A8J7J316_9CYAN|nr:hypothetical protein [Lusitaniella coriacea]MBE9116704.1 hypothetical protein [Lusitaniella coriacea LEGE 07157]
MLQKPIAAIAAVALTTSIVNVRPLQARSIACDFTVTVTQGSLAGNTFNGSFHYDDSALKGTGTEEIGVADGLTVIMNFLGRDYSETADTHYPKFPKLVFEDGIFQHLDFWLESGERRIWWELPGWEVDLSESDCPPTMPELSDPTPLRDRD